MDFFIRNAWAQSAPAGGASLIDFLPLIILFVVFYLFLIRPQLKRAKEHRKMVEALAKDDEVVTNGGVLGRINDMDDQFVELEIAKGVAVKVQRQAVSAVLPKGTLKSHLKSA